MCCSVKICDAYTMRISIKNSEVVLMQVAAWMHCKAFPKGNPQHLHHLLSIWLLAFGFCSFGSAVHSSDTLPFPSVLSFLGLLSP